MSSEDMFDDGPPAHDLEPDPDDPESVGEELSLAVNLTPMSQGSTPIELSGVVADQPVPVPTTATSPTVAAGPHICSVCSKLLKSRANLNKHLILHKLNDYNLRKPVLEEIVLALPSMLNRILKEIKEEPAVSVMGAQKKQCVEAFCSDSINVGAFLDSFSKQVIDSVLIKTKVMPTAQYEAAIVAVQKFLADPIFFENVKTKLLLCMPIEIVNSTSENVLNRLVWRMVTKFLSEIQEHVFHNMKMKLMSAQESHVMTEDEIQAFKLVIGNLLREVYRFGLKTQNSVWLLRCKVLLERCVESNGMSLSSEQFLSEQTWRDRLVTLSEPCFKIFQRVENIIQTLQTSDSACTAEKVFDKFTDDDNLLLFNDVHKLSRGILQEDLAIDFFQDLIKSFTATSGRLHAKMKADQARRKQHATSVSLRTNLKRNPAIGGSLVSNAGQECESGVPVLAAAQASASASTAHSERQERKSCKCSQPCNTKRCSCRAGARLCNLKCHKGTACSNK